MAELYIYLVEILLSLLHLLIVCLIRIKRNQGTILVMEGQCMLSPIMKILDLQPLSGPISEAILPKGGKMGMAVH